MNRFSHSLVSFFCVALLMAFVTTAWAQKGDVSAHPMIGDHAPPFELTSVGGQTLNLEGWKGKFVVLHFGASW
jgi:cytochrome oxidase Cu insertion factor (SCO1/SenC/PrrC family)